MANLLLGAVSANSSIKTHQIWISAISVKSGTFSDTGWYSKFFFKDFESVCDFHYCFVCSRCYIGRAPELNISPNFLSGHKNAEDSANLVMCVKEMKRQWKQVYEITDQWKELSSWSISGIFVDHFLHGFNQGQGHFMSDLTELLCQLERKTMKTIDIWSNCIGQSALR